MNYAISMLRTKVVALLLGPFGVGLVGMYTAITGLIGTFAGLGVGSSGVREVAAAHSKDDAHAMAETVTTLRRICWVTGGLGWFLTVVLSYPLSLLIFGSGEHTWAVALLGVTILLSAISDGQRALIQGTRRIGELARFQVAAAAVGALVSISLFAWLGQRAIVPALITTAGTNLCLSWSFARRIPHTHFPQNLRATWKKSKTLLTLGVALMWSSLVAACVALIIRAAIVRELGLQASGVYEAAWGISGMFASFILAAMGADFYPRITSLAHQHGEMNKLMNEQTEIGILLALPGLLGTLAFGPWIMHLFYSKEFLSGAELLPWFVLGIFGQVVSWPMGFSLIAEGAQRTYAVLETVGGLFRLALGVALLSQLGLWGVALSVPLLYLIYAFTLLVVCRRLTGFLWDRAVWTLLVKGALLIAAGFLAQRFLSRTTALWTGAALVAAACIISLRGIAARAGLNFWLVRAACQVPGLRFACGLGRA